MITCKGLGRTEILQRIPGLTYRQLDWWTRNGWLANHQHDAQGRVIPRPGDPRPGWRACWPLDQVRLLERMFILTQCGLHVEYAATIAADRVELTKMIKHLTKMECDLLEEEQQTREREGEAA